MYFCPGATHAPHQAPREWIEKYQGKFDAGWDAYREETHQRQLESGILPPGTELSPRPDWVKAWDTLSTDEKKLYAHMMEIFAGFLGHTDFHIGRLVQALDRLGDLENTLVIVVSDNGASGEGGYFGSFNENLIFNGVPDTFEENFKRIDELGGPNSYGHYPTGWTMAGNTPFKRWKRNVFNGGIADPMILSWPAGIQARGEIRAQYTHAIDVPATILDILNLEPPAMFNGVPQEAIAGTSFKATFENPQAEEVRALQYYELYGSRALYMDGWKAVTFHPVPGVPSDGPGDPNVPFTQDKWELYDTTKDFAEVHDLAAQEPDRLQMMIGLWFAEAGKYDVFPIHAYQRKAQRPKPAGKRTSYTYWPNTTHIDNEAAVDVRMRPFSVVALARVPEGTEGVLIAQGGRFAGWSFFIKDGHLIYEHNYLGLERFRVVSTEPVPAGDRELGLEFRITGKFDIAPALTAQGLQGVKGEVSLYIDHQLVGVGEIGKTVPFGWSLSGEGLCCGYDSETPVSDLYQSPFKFTGGIERVVVSVSGEPFHIVSKEVENAFIVQ
jgi:arylsulfatase